MNALHRIRPLKYRSIWISDLHLGSKDCRADYLLDFLKSTESEYLYLVGDIVDLWALKQRGLFWPQKHNDIIRTVLGKAKHGTRVIYVPGNHDDPVRDYDGMIFGNVEVRREYIHETADGRRLLLLHGDEFDSVVRCGKWTRRLGSHVYDLLLIINRLVNITRRSFGFSYWSLAAYLKHRVRNAVKHIRNFEEAVAYSAHERGVDGLVCGHIHHAEITQVGPVLYCNDGDWVESCTALVETHNGSLELLHWADHKHMLKSVSVEQARENKKIA